MYEAATFDPNSAASGSFNTNLPIGGKFVAFNESNVGLNFTFSDKTIMYLPAWTANIFVLSTPTPNVSWSQKVILAGNTNPISQVVIEAYLPNEAIIGTYPAPIQHTSYIPNTVSTAMGGSTSLQNDGNASGTQVYESTVTGSPGSNVIMQNQGLVEILQWVGAALTQIFKTDPGAASVVKLGNTGLTTESLGNMTVDQVLSVIGNTSLATLATSGLATLNSLTVQNAATLNSASVTNNATVGGTLGVTGNTSMSTASTSGKATLNSAEISTTLKVDTTSEFVGAATFDSNPILSNAISLQAKDSGGTARTVMQVDGGNNLQMFGVTGTDKFQLLSHGGTLQAVVDLVLGTLNLTGSSQSVNGDTTGTMTTYEAVTGTGLKIVLAEQNNYKNAGGGKIITLKNAFTAFFIIVGWGVGGINLNHSGGAVNMVLGNGALASGGAAITNATQYQGLNIGGLLSAFETISDNGGYASAHNGAVVIFGI